MEIRGRKPGSEEKPRSQQAPPHPRAPPGCPLKLGLQLPCHSPVPGLRKGRVRALDSVPCCEDTASAAGMWA